MIKLALVMLLACALGGADVMPGCGSRHHEQLVAPGGACGGPSRCTEATACATLDQSLTRGGVTSAYWCTKACQSDADCGGLSVKMTCTGSGRIAESPSQRVCLPTPEPTPKAP